MRLALFLLLPLFILLLFLLAAQYGSTQPRQELGAARGQLGDRVINVVFVRGVAAVLVARHGHAAKRGVSGGCGGRGRRGRGGGGGLSDISELSE